MKKTLGALFAVLLAAGLAARAQAADEKAKKEDKAPAVEEKKEAPAKGEAAEAPETIVMDKTAKMAPVKFPHKAHAEKTGGCAACHEGKEPLFAQKKSEEGMKMADMYAGKGCGSCHDGKKEVGGKKVFAAKGGCMKCHKK